VATGLPRATPINQHKFALCIEANSEYFRRGPSVFQGFLRDQNCS